MANGKLTEKQKRFADFYIKLGNATEAAIKANYSKKTAKSIGQENLTKPDVKNYIDKKMAEIASRRIMGATEALELLTSIARGEITEEVILPTIDGFARVEKRPDIKDRHKAAESILKRYPNSRQEELKDLFLEKQIEKADIEIERIKGGNGDAGKTIIVTGEDEMRRILNGGS